MLITLFTLLVGLIGVALVSYGAWLTFPPAGFIVCGCLCLFWSFMASKAAANQPAKEGK